MNKIWEKKFFILKNRYSVVYTQILLIKMWLIIF